LKSSHLHFLRFSEKKAGRADQEARDGLVRPAFLTVPDRSGTADAGTPKKIVCRHRVGRRRGRELFFLSLEGGLQIFQILGSALPDFH